MRFSILMLVTLASANSVMLDERAITNVPIVPVLPVPGYNVSSGGFSGLGNYYLSSAAQLASEITAIGKKCASH